MVMSKYLIGSLIGCFRRTQYIPSFIDFTRNIRFYLEGVWPWRLVGPVAGDVVNDL